MDQALKKKIIDLLRSRHVMTVATIRYDGFPQATIVNYVHDDLTLYFASDPTSQKVANINLNNKVAAAIAGETNDFNRLSGVSLSGIAGRLHEKEAARERAVSLFCKIPESKRFVPQEPQQLVIFSITPVAISLIDYASGFNKSFLVEF